MSGDGGTISAVIGSPRRRAPSLRRRHRSRSGCPVRRARSAARSRCRRAGRAPFPAVTTLTGSGAHYPRRQPHARTSLPALPADRGEAGRAAAWRRCASTIAAWANRTGDANAATAEDTAADAEAALAFLRARPEIDPRRVGLIGHSYGGEIAPMVAAADPAVAAVVLMAGPARPFRETMRYQHRYRIENDPGHPARRPRASAGGSHGRSRTPT